MSRTSYPTFVIAGAIPVAIVDSSPKKRELPLPVTGPRPLAPRQSYPRFVIPGAIAVDARN